MTLRSWMRLGLKAICLGLITLWAIACRAPEPSAEAPGDAPAESPVVADAPVEQVDPPRLRRDLGDYEKAISTDDPQAQAFFNQGMILTFGFNHEQAIAAFEEAARLDPDCAICKWGSAFAYGPNINLPMSPEANAMALAALAEAQARAEHASENERAFIEALATRYSPAEDADRAALDLAFADAMGKLSARFPDDLDAATLYADAMMNLYPWDYWTNEAEPREHTEKILAVLESVMERGPNHPGANHLYVHAVEEYFPEKGVPAADRLVTIAPDAGHLVHMSSHIYWRVGRYSEAVSSNRRAIKTDEELFAWCRGGDFYQIGYYPHNVHFLWAATSAGGQSAAAIGAARKLYEGVKAHADAWPFVQEWLAIPNLTLARFGRWNDVLAAEPPPEGWAYTRGIWHYTRGLAQLRRGDLASAEKEREAMDAISKDPAMEELLLAGGTSNAKALLAIAASHLTGELAAATGDTEQAEAALRSGVEQEGNLVYMEPPPWYMPMRQVLGVWLLEVGRAQEAESVYRKDLEKNPKNGWSLYGLAESLAAQGKDTEASLIRAGFAFAWERADVKLSASRF